MPQASSGHGIHMPGHADGLRVQLGQLRHENQNGQRVHETRHHRARHEAHQHAQLHPARDHLQHTGEHRGSQQVVQPMGFHQRDHDQRHRARGRRNHARATAHEGNDGGDGKRGVQTHLGIDPGNDGKSDRFGDQRQRHHQTGQHIAANVGQPVLSEILKQTRLSGAKACGWRSHTKSNENPSRAAHKTTPA